MAPIAMLSNSVRRLHYWKEINLKTKKTQGFEDKP